MKRVVTLLISIIICNTVSAQNDSAFFPVRLESFEVGISDNIVQLNWKTICYLQFANFQVQKSVNGKDFITIDSFVADKLRCRQPFDYKDSLAANQGNVFYRINVGNIDGEYFHSIIRHIYQKEKAFDLLDVYPTVVNHFITFSISDTENENFSAFIINQNGSVLQKNKLRTVKGVTKFQLRMDNLSKGYYWLRVYNERGKMKTAKFFKN